MEFEREIPMSIEAFHRMPWRLGWKHEYFDDRAYLSPSYVSMDVYLLPPSWPPEISGRPGEGSGTSQESARAAFQCYSGAS